MTGRLDYAKAKRGNRRGQFNTDHWPGRISLKGWRLEWPDEFPVTTTTIEPQQDPDEGQVNPDD